MLLLGHSYTTGASIVKSKSLMKMRVDPPELCGSVQVAVVPSTATWRPAQSEPPTVMTVSLDNFFPTIVSCSLPPAIEHLPEHVFVALVTTEHVETPHDVHVAAPSRLNLPTSQATQVPALSAPTLEPTVLTGHAVHSKSAWRPVLLPYRPTLHRPGHSPLAVRPRSLDHVPFGQRPSHCESAWRSAPAFADHLPGAHPWQTVSEIGYAATGQLFARTRWASLFCVS